LLVRRSDWNDQVRTGGPKSGPPYSDAQQAWPMVKDTNL